MLFCSLNNGMIPAPSLEVEKGRLLTMSDAEASYLLGPNGKDSLSGASFEQVRAKRYYNRFLNFTRLGSIIDDAAESFFKSEIRRRLFVTAVLIIVSRIGYFIPLPGFDRRLIPDTYLSFDAGSTGTYFYLVFYWQFGQYIFINQNTDKMSTDIWKEYN